MRLLAESNVHVEIWCTWLDAATDPALCSEYLSLLTPDELTRYHRFLFAKDRHQFLVARTLCRCALSHYASVEPAAWRFEQNVYGKPHIAGPAGISLSFNVSHSRGLVACAVAAEGRIGLDVECLDRKTSGADLARRYFAAEEVADLEAAPPVQQHALFFRFWTLKESYIKAHGRGLSIPLDSFAFRLQPDEPVRLIRHDAAGEDPMDWQFATLDLTDNYLLALAVDQPDQQALKIAVRQCVPLRDIYVRQQLPPSGRRNWELARVKW